MAGFAQVAAVVPCSEHRYLLKGVLRLVWASVPGPILNSCHQGGLVI